MYRHLGDFIKIQYFWQITKKIFKPLLAIAVANKELLKFNAVDPNSFVNNVKYNVAFK